MVGKTTVKNVTKDDLVDTIQISGWQVQLQKSHKYSVPLTGTIKHWALELSTCQACYHHLLWINMEFNNLVVTELEMEVVKDDEGC